MRADRDRLADALQAIGMRHVLVHGYFEVDLDLVWLVVENELDKLKSMITSAMADLAMQGDEAHC